MLSWLPEGASTYAADIDWVMTFIYWVCGVWFVISEVLLAYLVVRYRQRDGVRAAWIPGDKLSTMAWVLVPVAAVLVCDLIIENVADPVWHKVKIHVPESPALTVRVTARQYAWLFTYPGKDGELGTADDFTESELRVPVDREVLMELEATDVLHSFWVPELRLKQDVIPGRRIPAWFEVTKEGTYTIACAELCGTGHTMMKASLVAQPGEAFDVWLLSNEGT